MLVNVLFSEVCKSKPSFWLELVVISVNVLLSEKYNSIPIVLELDVMFDKTELSVLETTKPLLLSMSDPETVILSTVEPSALQRIRLDSVLFSIVAV